MSTPETDPSITPDAATAAAESPVRVKGAAPAAAPRVTEDVEQRLRKIDMTAWILGNQIKELRMALGISPSQ